MSIMHTLTNTTRPKKKIQRVGRGVGSKRGRTCGRGEKGAGSRAGYKRRWGYEGGQMRLHMKLPKRGFSRAPFRSEYDIVNLGMIDAVFSDGDVVDPSSLHMKGLIPSKGHGVKLLGDGTLTKKVKVILHALSSSAQVALEEAGIEFQLID